MTTKAKISEWFDQAAAEKATHMVIVVDTFSYEDYPVNVPVGTDVKDVIAKYDGLNMQRVMEVYMMSLDKDKQLDETRAYHIES